MPPLYPPPDDVTLRNFLLGEAARGHRGWCAAVSGKSIPQVPRRWRRLAADDTFVEHLRDCSSKPAPPSPILSELMMRLERLPRLEPAAGQTAASTGSIANKNAAAGPSMSNCDPNEATVAPGANPLSFLEATGDSQTQQPTKADGDVPDFLAAPAVAGELGQLGGYRILRVLGSGGMGMVFEARDGQLDRRVALKVMRPNVALNATAKERFLREAKAAAAIEDDHIIPIFHVGEANGVPFLTMPMLKGESLDARMKQLGVLPAAEVVRIGREVALGLAAAHERRGSSIATSSQPTSGWKPSRPVWVDTIASRSSILAWHAPPIRRKTKRRCN